MVTVDKLVIFIFFNMYCDFTIIVCRLAYMSVSRVFCGPTVGNINTLLTEFISVSEFRSYNFSMSKDIYVASGQI